MVLAGLLFFALATAVGADVPRAQRAEVEHLVAFIADSDCAMRRNGKVHDAAEAAAHVRRKYEHFRDEIASTEDFIARAATRSLVSGRPYAVLCPGQPDRPAGDWLLDELAAFRERAAL